MIIGRETKKFENRPTIGSAFCLVFIIQYIDHKTVDNKANKTPSIFEKFKEKGSPFVEIIKTPK